jgi:hypothetical protein
VRVTFLRRYPFAIFYRIRTDRVLILHLRHSARRPWRRGLLDRL